IVFLKIQNELCTGLFFQTFKTAMGEINSVFSHMDRQGLYWEIVLPNCQENLIHEPDWITRSLYLLHTPKRFRRGSTIQVLALLVIVCHDS
ncbi:hypothetical protein ACQP3F_30130, partial [Escherichia coli]